MSDKLTGGKADRPLNYTEKAILMTIVFSIKEAFHTRQRELPDTFYSIGKVLSLATAPKALTVKEAIDQFRSSLEDGDYGTLPHRFWELFEALDDLLAGSPANEKKAKKVKCADESVDQVGD